MSQTQQELGSGSLTKSPFPVKDCPSIVRPHNTHHHHHPEGSGRPSDPLKAFEHHMLAHPSTLPGPYQRFSTGTLTVPAVQHHPRPMVYRSPSLPHSLSFSPQASPARSPAMISPVASRSPSRSRTPSPSPSPDARRCMAAMATWTPRFDRRSSFDGQEYRRAQMLQTTGINPVGTSDDHDAHSIRSDHSGLSDHSDFENNYTFGSASQSCHVPRHTHHRGGSCGSYEINRGFSECLDGLEGLDGIRGHETELRG